MLLAKGTRDGAIHALINVWLKDPTKRCGWCGKRYFPQEFPCCDQPFIANNAGIMKQFYRDQLWIRSTRKNSTASMKARGTKSMRWVLSFPPSLLFFLETAFKRQYHEKLFHGKYNLVWFAKRFGKYFQIPERV
ncbi:MAG: hypothetical protein D4S01_11550 [Dehalococcoidia bacterium]|nr:MAG: hypothetical protein D4S01_11550 [Dehalococcoidia bacterium]